MNFYKTVRFHLFVQFSVKICESFTKYNSSKKQNFFSVKHREVRQNAQIKSNQKVVQNKSKIRERIRKNYREIRKKPHMTGSEFLLISIKILNSLKVG